MFILDESYCTCQQSLQHDCSHAGFMQRKQQYTSAKMLFQTDRYVGVHWDEEQYLICDINYKIMFKEPVHTSWCIAVKWVYNGSYI